MQQLALILLAILAGAVLPVQAAINAGLGKAVKSPTYGALLSFVVGLVGLFVYCLIERIDFTTLRDAVKAPLVYWAGGLLGAFYVTVTILIAPRLGTALTFGLIVAGQMTITLLIDQLGLFGVPVLQITWQRALGILMIIGGVLLIRW